MHVFYTPDIQSHAELPEEEAAHAVRVLRLQTGDEVTLTDGKGNFYRAEISTATISAPCQPARNHSSDTFMERASAHRNGSHQKHGPHRMVCREGYRDRF